MIDGLKIFCVNETDSVVGKSIEEVKKWYSIEMDYPLDDIKVVEVKDYDQFYYEELGGLSEVVETLERAKNKESHTFSKINGTYFEVISFKNALASIDNYQIPFVLCSTEY